jgi:hypothetical protein
MVSGTGQVKRVKKIKKTLDRRKLETNFVAYRKSKHTQVWVEREIEYTTVSREAIRRK